MLLSTPSSRSTRPQPKVSALVSIGTTCCTEEAIDELLHAGMHVACFDLGRHSAKWIREAHAVLNARCQALGTTCGVWFDVKRPQIAVRTETGTAMLVRDQSVTVCYRDDAQRIPGTLHTLRVSFDLAPYVTAGMRLVLGGDHFTLLDVVEVDKDGGRMMCRVDEGGQLLEDGVALCVPGAQIEWPCTAERCRAAAELAAELGAHIVALPYAYSADHVEQLRGALSDAGAHAGTLVFARIDCRVALQNARDVMSACDGIVIARYNMIADVAVEQLGPAQTDLLRMAQFDASIPCIISQGVLKTMRTKPRPSRNEVTDVASAVLAGAHGLQLTLSTASDDAQWCAKACSMLLAIAAEAEADVDFSEEYATRAVVWSRPPMRRTESIAGAAVQVALDVGAALIVCYTVSGLTARLLSHYRPPCPVLAVTTERMPAGALTVVRGTLTALVPEVEGVTEHQRGTVESALELPDLFSACLKHNLAPKGSAIVVLRRLQLQETRGTDDSHGFMEVYEL